MAKRKDQDWLSVVEAAKRLGVTRETVYAAIEAGRLKAEVREVVRRALRIDPKSLASFEVSRTRQRIGKRAARARYGKGRN